MYVNTQINALEYVSIILMIQAQDRKIIFG